MFNQIIRILIWFVLDYLPCLWQQMVESVPLQIALIVVGVLVIAMIMLHNKQPPNLIDL